MKKPSALLLLLLAAIAITGCTTPPKTAEQKTKDDEYVYLPPATGSNVPRRVKKADLLAGKVPNAGDAQTVDKDSFARSISPGTKLDSGPR